MLGMHSVLLNLKVNTELTTNVHVINLCFDHLASK